MEVHVPHDPIANIIMAQENSQINHSGLIREAIEAAVHDVETRPAKACSQVEEEADNVPFRQESVDGESLRQLKTDKKPPTLTSDDTGGAVVVADEFEISSRSKSKELSVKLEISPKMDIQQEAHFADVGEITRDMNLTPIDAADPSVTIVKMESFGTTCMAAN